ncbi:glycerol-3-phosphate dehydrogenase [uncultured Tateyamaria sp.]|uniref:glycerol-3-phosphate dehydrogenase n=1 Tax=uncultured Tateyamaria sp. TaxID=455651 RepID=UPI00260F9ACD|nr:glycerol-3-phosphate dehydrogenase [uncultured Tateyamaria sp.]
MADDKIYDLFVIGGGINGAGIARDASGRGLSVALAEAGDLGGATSSASTKLFHGGLRYLEFFEFGLVKSALKEREVLLKAMPHISWPMRFVLPYAPDMRFDSDTPTSRLLRVTMPWIEKGRRPAWLVRLGLFLYDNLGGREILPGTKTLDLTTAPEGKPLKDRFKMAYEYSDAWVEDSRLVMLNARDAEARGATILTRCAVKEATRDGDVWRIETEKGTFRAKALVNAGGPWVADILTGVMRQNTQHNIRLVRGSHIVTKRLYDHDKCYFFQGTDGRIIFAIPYEQDFTLIGTTDAEHTDADTKPAITDEERDYLCAFATEYFEKPVTPADVVWTYSGVRPLYDDGASSATAATRDYVLALDENGPSVLSVFGGKITTYRKLAEQALAKMGLGEKWTAGVPLPGGDFKVSEVGSLTAKLAGDYPFLDQKWAARLIRAYGTEAWDVLGDAKSADDIGPDFGSTLTGAELKWMMAREYAVAGDDALWRRTKLGLRLSEDERAAVDDWMKENAA